MWKDLAVRVDCKVRMNLQHDLAAKIVKTTLSTLDEYGYTLDELVGDYKKRRLFYYWVATVYHVRLRL